MKCDQLDEASTQRLNIMMQDIDDHLDEIKQEQIDFYSGDCDKSQMSKQTDSNNAYLYSMDDATAMERINESLRKNAPMLMPSTNDDDKSFAF